MLCVALGIHSIEELKLELKEFALYRFGRNDFAEQVDKFGKERCFFSGQGERPTHERTLFHGHVGGILIEVEQSGKPAVVEGDEQREGDGTDEELLISGDNSR